LENETFAPHINTGFLPSGLSEDEKTFLWDASDEDDERVVSRLTVLMYLNDDFIGGKTLLLLCTKVMMMILLWTTYKQGQFFGCLHFLVLQVLSPAWNQSIQGLLARWPGAASILPALLLSLSFLFERH
jgi:hypothetical protein